MSSNSVPSPAVPSVRRSAGLALLGSELTVLFRRRRTWAMLVAIALIPILLAVAVRLSSETLAPGEGPPFLDRVTQNGLFVAFTAMVVAIPLFLPLTIGVVAGDTIAGEAGLGTLRYLLVAPAGRVRLLLVKYAGVAVFCLAATLTLAVAGTLIGAALFPVGPVTLLSGDVIGVPESLLRSALISLYVYLNFQQGPGDLPADEVALTFATVAIHSCAEAANAAQIDKQIQQLVEADVQEKGAESAWQQQQFGCAQVGCLWLMITLTAFQRVHKHTLLGDSTSISAHLPDSADMSAACGSSFVC
jgi:hypothetical protein